MIECPGRLQDVFFFSLSRPHVRALLEGSALDNFLTKPTSMPKKKNETHKQPTKKNRTFFLYFFSNCQLTTNSTHHAYAYTDV